MVDGAASADQPFVQISTVGRWKTTPEDTFRPPAEATLRCGMYQGAARSPLLFCVGLNPLSQALAYLYAKTSTH